MDSTASTMLSEVLTSFQTVADFKLAVVYWAERVRTTRLHCRPLNLDSISLSIYLAVILESYCSMLRVFYRRVNSSRLLALAMVNIYFEIRYRILISIICVFK